MLYTNHQTTLYYRALFDHKGNLHKILPEGYATAADIPTPTLTQAREACIPAGCGWRWGIVSKIETIKRED